MGDTSSLYCCVDGEGYRVGTFPCWLQASVRILLSSLVTRLKFVSSVTLKGVAF